MKRFCGLCLLTAATLVPGSAQIYPGQYPPGQYPPGQYPPGQYPPGDPNDPNRQPNSGGLSIPRRHKKNDKASENNLNTIAADAYTVTNGEKKLVVATDDGRTLTMTVDAKTAFTKDGATITSSKIEQGSFVHVVAAEDDEDYLTAVTVALLKDPAPKTAAAEDGEPGAVAPRPAAPPVDPKVAAELAKPAATDAPDRPILRHGKPPGRNEFPEDEVPPAPAKPAATAAAKTSAPAAKKDSGDFTITPEDTNHTRVAATTTKSRAAANGQTRLLRDYPIIFASRSPPGIRKNHVLPAGRPSTWSPQNSWSKTGTKNTRKSPLADVERTRACSKLAAVHPRANSPDTCKRYCSPMPPSSNSLNRPAFKARLPLSTTSWCLYAGTGVFGPSPLAANRCGRNIAARFRWKIHGPSPADRIPS